jgi:hypothetical protein
MSNSFYILVSFKYLNKKLNVLLILFECLNKNGKLMVCHFLLNVFCMLVFFQSILWRLAFLKLHLHSN